MRTLVAGAGARVRARAQLFQDRHGRRARALAVMFEGANHDQDDDVVVINPWHVRLPRTVIYAVARSRGWEPVGGTSALVQRGPWLEPMRFARCSQ